MAASHNALHKCSPFTIYPSRIQRHCIPPLASANSEFLSVSACAEAGCGALRYNRTLPILLGQGEGSRVRFSFNIRGVKQTPMIHRHAHAVTPPFSVHGVVNKRGPAGRPLAGGTQNPPAVERSEQEHFYQLAQPTQPVTHFRNTHRHTHTREHAHTHRHRHRQTNTQSK